MKRSFTSAVRRTLMLNAAAAEALDDVRDGTPRATYAKNLLHTLVANPEVARDLILGEPPQPPGRAGADPRLDVRLPADLAQSFDELVDGRMKWGEALQVAFLLDKEGFLDGLVDRQGAVDRRGAKSQDDEDGEDDGQPSARAKAKAKEPRTSGHVDRNSRRGDGPFGMRPLDPDEVDPEYIDEDGRIDPFIVRRLQYSISLRERMARPDNVQDRKLAELADQVEQQRRVEFWDSDSAAEVMVANRAAYQEETDGLIERVERPGRSTLATTEWTDAEQLLLAKRLTELEPGESLVVMYGVNRAQRGDLRFQGLADPSEAAEGLAETIQLLAKGGDWDILTHRVERVYGDQVELIELRGKAFWRVDKFAFNEAGPVLQWWLLKGYRGRPWAGARMR